MNISVAIATYNGEKYISEQIESIAVQLTRYDEIIISDDGSTDKTIDIILILKKKYDFITLIKGPQKGVIMNFENALKKCKNEIIFLSDQDDVWDIYKVKKVKEIFERNKDILLILHNMDIFDEHQVLKSKLINYRKGITINILKSCYWGCCMVFRREILDLSLPFPKSIPAHDQFIGLISEKKRSTFFINESLIRHRIHESNKTKKQKIMKRIYFRLRLFKSYLNADF